MNTTRPIWPTQYHVGPPIPKWFRDGLERAGGKNPYGDPTWRVVWAMDARTFRNDNPKAIKCINPNDPDLGWACFWLERWAPPEFFNKDTWEKDRYGPCMAGTDHIIDFIGEFPSRGDYIGVAPLVKDGDDGEPYEMHKLTSGLLEEIVGRISFMGKNLGAGSVLAAIETARRVKKAKDEARVRALLDERNEHYRINQERINREAARGYVGLLSSLPKSAHERTASLVTI